jgi:hypothetical protein
MEEIEERTKRPEASERTAGRRRFPLWWTDRARQPYGEREAPPILPLGGGATTTTQYTPPCTAEPVRRP